MNYNYNHSQAVLTTAWSKNEKSVSTTKGFDSLKQFMLLMLFFFGMASMQGQNVTVNPGAGSYPTLKDAFDAINLGTHTGMVTVSIIGNTTETASAVLNASGAGAANYTAITISPSGGAVRTIIGNIAGHLIDLNGADNVTIDGLDTGGNALTVSNTSTLSASAVRFTNDASNNTINKCSVLGSTTGVGGFGVIYFATGTTTGNDGNTISNCIISAAGANLPVTGIFSFGTSTAIDNSGNIINNNSISNFFDAGNASNGMNINSGNSAWTVTNNSLFQSATRIYTTANVHNGIVITSGSGYNITGNYIGGNVANAGGTPYTMAGAATRFVAINAGVGTTIVNNIQGNTIANIYLNTSSNAGTTNGIICGINVTSGNVNIGTITANTIGSSTGVDSIKGVSSTTGGLVVGINSSSTGTISIQNNTIGGLSSSGVAATIAGSITGINVAGVAASMTISSNTIGNTIADNMRGGTSGLTTGSSLVTGINFPSTPTIATVTNNIIRNMSSFGSGTSGTLRGILTVALTGTNLYTIIGNTISNLTTNTGNTTISNGLAATGGICLSPGSNCVISQNTIHTIANTNTATTASFVVGISQGNATNTTISRNKIYNLTNAGTSTSVTAPSIVAGILVRSGTTAININNNMISLGNGQTTNTAFIGIMGQHGSTPDPIDNIYFNTINIEGTVTAGAQPSFGIARTDFSATARTPQMNVKNNIVTNTRSGGTGVHCAIANNYGATASITGWGAGSSNNNVLNAAAGNVGWWTTAQTFSAWQTTSLGDGSSLNSVSVTYTAAATGDLHLNMGVTPTQIESAGTAIAGIAIDYDNQARPGPAGSVNGAGFAPDMGADEFDGVYLDLSAPIVAYTPLSFTCDGTVNRTLTTTITDATGVPTTGSGLPKLYWRINAGTWNSVTATFVSGSTFTFSFGAGAVLTDVVQYYIVAQDTAVTPNVGATPSAGATGFSANSPTATTPPTTPSSYTITNVLNGGTYTVGTTGTYTTLTAAVADYNTKCITGPIVFNLLDATYPTEIYPITIQNNGYASATNTLTIKPATGVTTTISGAAANTQIFKILGKYVTIDGSNNGTTTRDLTLSNTSATVPSILWIGSTGTTPITNVTLKNTIAINGSNTNTCIFLGDGTTFSNSGYFNNITIQNNSIQKAYIGLYINGIATTGNGTGTLVTGNDLNTTGANSIRLAGLYAQGTDGVTISNNNVGNMINTADATNFTGIWVATGTVNATVSDNTITAMSSTTTGPRGIFVSSGVAASNINVNKNTVTNLTSSNAATAGRSIGISVSFGTEGVMIQNNKVSNIKQTSTAGWGCNGIQLASTSATANVKVYNNFVSDVAAYGFAGRSEDDNGYGIIALSGAGYDIYHNTVEMNTNQTATTGLPAAFIATVGVTAANAINLKNNIFTNSQTIGVERYAIASAAPNSVFASIDFNDYYTTGPNLGFIGSNRIALADVVSGFGSNVNSKNILPVYTSATDLHLPIASNATLDGLGTPIATVTTDIDNATRSTTAPDMGADEFCGTPVAPTGAAAQSFCSAAIPTVASLVATPLAGHTISWYAASSGGTALASTIALVDGIHYFASQTNTGGGCESTARFDVTATVVTNPVAPTGTAAQSFCSATTPTVANLMATALAGHTIKWYDAATAGTLLASTTALVDGTHYFASQTITAGGCESTTRFDVTATVVTNPVAPTGTALQSFCSATTPTLANLMATALAGHTIKWYDAATAGTLLASTTALVDGTHYFASQTITAGGCESTTRFDVTATVVTTPVAPTGAVAQAFCGSGTVANLAATALASHTIKWYDAASGGTLLTSATALVSGTHYFASQTITAGGCESTSRLDVTVTINALPVLTITNPAAVCTPTTVDITVAAVTAGSDSGLTLSYYTDAAATLSYATPAAAPAGTYYIKAVNATTCVKIMPVTVTVNAAPSAITITPASASICIGAIQQLTATSTSLPVTGTIGTATTLTGATAQPTAFCNRWPNYRSQTIYTAADLTAAGLSAGNITSLAYNIATAGDGLTNPNTIVKIGTIAGTSFATAAFDVTTGYTTVYGPATYTHTASGWQTITFSTPFVWDGTSNIVVEMAHDGADATNNSTTFFTATTDNKTVWQRSLPTGTVTLSVNRLNIRFVVGPPATCSWTPATNLYTDAAATVPYVALANATTVYTKPTAAGPTTYTALVTNAASCTNTQSVVVTANALPVLVVTNPAAVCAPTTVDITAAAVTAGSDSGLTLSYYTNAAATTVYATPAAATAGTYYIKAVNASSCMTIMPVTVTVNPTPSAITITPAGPATVCAGTIQSLIASGGTLSGNAQIGNAATLTGATSEPTAFCNRWKHYWSQMVFTPAELMAQGLTAGASINSLTFNITTLGDGTSVSDFKIYMGTSATPTVTAFTTAGLTQVFASATYSHAVGVNTMTFQTPYIWDGTSNVIVDVRQTGADALNNSVTAFTATTGNTAIEARTSTVFASSDLYAASAPAFRVSTQRLNSTFGWTKAANITWSPTTDLYTDSGATASYIGGNNATVYVKSTTAGTTNYVATATAGSCTSTATVAVTISVTPAPTGTAAQTICNAGTVANLTATGTGTIQWYAAATGGTALASTTALATATHYYASQTVAGCESLTRFDVTVTISAPAAPTGTAAQSFCSGASPTVASLTASGTGTIQWYAAVTGGTALASTTALTTATNYFASQTIAGCESATRLDVTVTVTPSLTSNFATIPALCTGATAPTLALTSPNGVAGTWSPTAVSNTTSGSYVFTPTSSCNTGQTLNVTVNPLPTVTASANQTICNGGMATISATCSALTVSSTLSGTSEVPSNASTATGSVTGTFNPGTNQLSLNITFSGLAASASASHIHQAAVGTNGAVQIAFTGVPAATSGSFTYTGTLTAAQATSLSAGLFYVNIHNASFPGGEIRGQLSSTCANSFSWDNGGGTGQSVMVMPTATTTYTVTATNTATGCTATAQTTVTVNAVTPAPTGTAAQTFCNSGTVAGLTATGTGTIQWYAAATGGTALASTTALVNGTHYYASQTVATCESPTRFDVTVTISAPATPTGTAAQAFCSTSSPTVASLTATGTAIQWYAAATGGAALANTTALVNATHYYASQTIAGCESALRFDVTATVNAATCPVIDWANLQWPPSGTINNCGTHTVYAQVYKAGVTEAAGAGAGITAWIGYKTTNSNPNTWAAGDWHLATFNTQAGNNDEYQYAITGLPAGSYFIASRFQSNGGAYYYGGYNAGGGGAWDGTTNVSGTLTVANQAAPTGAATQTFCSGETVGLIVVTGTGVIWYNAATGGSVVPNATLLVTGTTYYASQTVSGCESPTRLAVTMTSGGCLGTNAFDSTAFSYYPNPTTDFLNLVYSQELTSVKVTNMLGQELFTKTINATETQLDMSNLPTGTYLVEVTAGDVSKTIKVVKK
jgi:hypothetical protein